MAENEKTGRVQIFALTERHDFGYICGGKLFILKEVVTLQSGMV